MSVSRLNILLILHLPWIATVNITVYENARLNDAYIRPAVSSFSSIPTRDACICQCLMNSICKTATFVGSDQTCSLYSMNIHKAMLQVIPKGTNSSVITSTDASALGYSTPVTFDHASNSTSISHIIPNGYANLTSNNTKYVDATAAQLQSDQLAGVRGEPLQMYNPTSSNVTV